MPNADRSPRRWRVGINAHLLSGQAGYRRAGIHNYIAQVLDHLPQDQGGLRYVVYGRRAGLPSNGGSLRFRYSRWPTERRVVRILWEQLAWPLLARQDGVDLLHSMAFVTPLLAARPAVVTIYDLSFMHYPQSFPRLQQQYLAAQTGRSCRYARRVITISEASRQDVTRFFGVPSQNIDVITPGVDDCFRVLPRAEVEAFRRRHDLPPEVVLHVGTLQPRKNIPLLLDAFARLAHPQACLVLAGGKGWLYDEIYARVQELGLEEQVRFTGYVSDEELPYWYNAAAVLVFPSVHEGFGLPVVEAMACGTPVIAADSTSIPEAGGHAALYFAPHDVERLTGHLADVLGDPSLAARMSAAGLEQARGFSWKEAGRKTADVYRRALAV